MNDKFIEAPLLKVSAQDQRKRKFILINGLPSIVSFINDVEDNDVEDRLLKRFNATSDEVLMPGYESIMAAGELFPFAHPMRSPCMADYFPADACHVFGGVSEETIIDNLCEPFAGLSSLKLSEDDLGSELARGFVPISGATLSSLCKLDSFRSISTDDKVATTIAAIPESVTSLHSSINDKQKNGHRISLGFFNQSQASSDLLLINNVEESSNSASGPQSG